MDSRPFVLGRRPPPTLSGCLLPQDLSDRCGPEHQRDRSPPVAVSGSHCARACARRVAMV